ncbi:hypothetical protein GGR58DRAFT_506913 [Xylaria digitata]|nr:hypothetical protein GGR58DRAFT_506913 [Xylaria digitata]
MNFTRSTARSVLARSTRVGRTPCPTHARFQSSSSSSTSSTSSNVGGQGSSHIAAGAAGGLAAGIALYSIYLITPSGKMHRTINKGAKEVHKKYDEAAKKLQGQTPGADEAIKYIKEFAYSYVAWVPGGKQYVDTVFKDIETLKENHRDVNEIVNGAYKQFQQLSRSGFSLETASNAYNILADLSKKFGDLAGNPLTDILDNHPQAKKKFGGSIDQLKEMGENYGPEAKKQVDQTWNEAKEILRGGVSAANLDRGLEGAKSYLDKNPKVRELVEKNASVLKQGNAKEVFEQAKKAVESGETGALEDYVNKAKSKSEQAASNLGIDQYFKMIPSGSEVLEKLNQLREVAEEHTNEGEKLLKETTDELKQVLEKNSIKTTLPGGADLGSPGGDGEEPTWAMQPQIHRSGVVPNDEVLVKSLYKQLLKDKWKLQYKAAHDYPDEYGLPPSLLGNSIISFQDNAQNSHNRLRRLQWLQRKWAFFRAHREIKEKDVYIATKRSFLTWIEQRFGPETTSGALQDLCFIVGGYVFWVDLAVVTALPPFGLSPDLESGYYGDDNVSGSYITGYSGSSASGSALCEGSSSSVSGRVRRWQGNIQQPRGSWR